MASLSAIRDGLADRLRTLPALRVFTYVPGTIPPPAAIVRPEELQFDATMGRGSDTFVFLVHLAVSKSWDRTGQDLLDSYLAGSGTDSVKQAIEADDSLGGTVDWSRLVSMTDYGLLAFGETQYFGCDLRVEAQASGTS